MKRWSFYQKSDGRFIGLRRLTSNEEAVRRETPAGCVPIEGYYNRFRQRFDLDTGEVIVDESLAALRER